MLSLLVASTMLSPSFLGLPENLEGNSLVPFLQSIVISHFIVATMVPWRAIFSSNEAPLLTELWWHVGNHLRLSLSISTTILGTPLPIRLVDVVPSAIAAAQFFAIFLASAALRCGHRPVLPKRRQDPHRLRP